MAVAIASRARADGSVELTVDDHDGLYQVRGSFTVAASVDTVWAVLTDYQGIPRFVKSMKSSVVERGPEGQRVVRQDAAQHVLLFRKTIHVALEIQEDRPFRVGFQDVLKRDFHVFEGAWTVESNGGTVTVRYALDARPTTQPPGMIGRMVMSGGARDQLEQVRAEILRRQRSTHEKEKDDD
jgi:uncharacterized protein YndB with AHSA1/START domain